MPMIRTYKYRIKDKSAKKTLARMARAVNFVWNYCCAYQRDTEDRYRAGAPKRKWATHFDLTKLCQGVGIDLGINQKTVGEVCRQFSESRDKVRGAPRFRSSFGSKRALGWIPFTKQARQIEDNSITYLAKRYRFWEGGRPLPDVAKGGHFTEDAQGRWYVCFYVDAADRAAGKGEIGIDLGLKSFAALSNGRTVAPPQIYRKHERRLAVAQRARNIQRVRALHAKIRNSRRDFLHKLSTELAARYALIAVGNVNATRLAKTWVSKSANDAGWSAFRRMLAYKLAGYVEVDEKFTTQACSCCGAIPDSSPKGRAGLGIRDWICDGCGETHDRDVNAAKNILRLALSAQRLAGGSRELAA